MPYLIEISHNDITYLSNHFEVDNLLPDYIFESCNNRPITTHVCIYLTIRSDPRVHLDNKSIERDTCRLLLSEDYIDMEAKT